MQVTKKEMQKEKSTNEGEEGVLVVFWLCSPRPLPLLLTNPLSPTQAARSLPATLFVLAPRSYFISQPTVEGHKLSFARHEIILHVRARN